MLILLWRPLRRRFIAPYALDTLNQSVYLLALAEEDIFSVRDSSSRTYVMALENTDSAVLNPLNQPVLATSIHSNVTVTLGLSTSLLPEPS